MLMSNLLATTLGVTSLRMATMPPHILAKNVDEEQHNDGSHFKPWTPYYGRSGWNELQDNHKEAEWKMTKSL